MVIVEERYRQRDGQPLLSVFSRQSALQVQEALELCEQLDSDFLEGTGLKNF